ncbi:hypothetical protein EIP93_21725 [Pectobacterium versatile]|nr:hypothetical protein EIP93_21725 [Pectobacterium versatile]
MTNLPGADLNAACSGPNGARLMDEPSNERCQRTCNLKYDEYTRGMDRASPTLTFTFLLRQQYPFPAFPVFSSSACGNIDN